MKKIIIILSIFLILPAISPAKVGVGINLGRIVIDESLKPGVTYDLPIVGVINTGDSEGEFKVGIAYHENQPQFKPAQEWFEFSPSLFKLTGGELKNIAWQLKLPLKVKPGDYFAYIEAQPILEQEPGTTFGIAAASELHFKVLPANIFQASYYKLSSLLNRYSPWTYIVLTTLILALLMGFLAKSFSFQVNIRRKRS